METIWKSTSLHADPVEEGVAVLAEALQGEAGEKGQ